MGLGSWGGVFMMAAALALGSKIAVAAGALKAPVQQPPKVTSPKASVRAA
jgi:hypothetical protein